MPSEPRSWGKICLGTRLEKQVEADFVLTWTGLLLSGLRKGDAVRTERGKVAHVSANSIIRAFLTDTKCDSLLFLDSDAEVEPNFISQLRDYQPGWAYDALQAFHVRRNNPSEAIWYTRDGDGLIQCLVINEGVMDVGLIGTHAAIFRREVFTGIYEAYGKGIDFEDFQWFCYPRHQRKSDEATLSLEAGDLGFRLGATTDIRAGHISKAALGWTEYQEFLAKTHARERAKYYERLAGLVAEFTGEERRAVEAKAMLGSKNVLDGWDKHQPKDAEQVRAFYGARDNGYLYDLLAWNWSDPYWQILQPLRKVEGMRVLVIGAGLGSEAEVLVDKNQVDVFELPGTLKEFCKSRLDERVNFLDGDRLEQGNGLHQYDLIVAIDTIEHVHPDELDGFLDAVALSLAPGGSLYAHNNFGQEDLYPMHFDHAERFKTWLEKNGMENVSGYEYRKTQVPERV